MSSNNSSVAKCLNISPVASYSSLPSIKQLHQCVCSDKLFPTSLNIATPLPLSIDVFSFRVKFSFITSYHFFKFFFFR